MAKTQRKLREKMALSGETLKSTDALIKDDIRVLRTLTESQGHSR
jgi:hypothetical protein